MSCDLRTSCLPIRLLTHQTGLAACFQPLLVDDLGSLTLQVSTPDTYPLQPACLYLVDCKNETSEALSQTLQQIGHLIPIPIALLNLQPEQAMPLLERHPSIRGVFYPQTTPKQLQSGIRQLLAGHDWLPQDLSEHLLAQWRRMQQLNNSSRTSLTNREREILTLSSQGLSNSEIAHRLGLSPHTVKSHVHNLLRKVGVATRAEAIACFRGQLEHCVN